MYKNCFVKFSPNIFFYCYLNKSPISKVAAQALLYNLIIFSNLMITCLQPPSCPGCVMSWMVPWTGLCRLNTRERRISLLKSSSDDLTYNELSTSWCTIGESAAMCLFLQRLFYIKMLNTFENKESISIKAYGTSLLLETKFEIMIKMHVKIFYIFTFFCSI